MDQAPGLFPWDDDAGPSGLAPGEARAWLVELDAGLALASGLDATTGPNAEDLALLSDDERTRAARFVRPRDGRRFARCRAALRRILGRLLETPGASLRFRAVARGKPELDPGQGAGVGAALTGGRRPTLRFNVSHSADLALIAICHGHEIGADLERLREISHAERIVESFFTPAERAAFATVPAPERSLVFHRGWTRKEAVLKGLGVGISGLSARLETGFGATALGPGFTRAVPDRVDRWQLWEAAPRPGFVAALAIDRGPGPSIGDEPFDPVARCP